MGRYLDYASPKGEQVPNASTSESGFMSAADKTKLDGIPSGGGGGGSSSLFRFIFVVVPGVGAGARSCPGAQVGDIVVNVMGYANTGLPTDPCSDFGANFETTITVQDQIQQLSGNLALNYVVPVLRRTTVS